MKNLLILFFLLLTVFNSNAQSNKIQKNLKDDNLDLDLVSLIKKIIDLDKKYRINDTTDWSKQKPIDKENQHLIDSLFNKHKKYIGTSLVGETYNYGMWAVIQHSNIEMMENYLPIVQKAVKNKELDIFPLKMLIDRFYGLKYGYQFFGTQVGFGFKLADDEKRKEIQLKYGIE
jgi:hypothetical protein